MRTIREQIIERMIAQLGTITQINGYENEIGPDCIYRECAIIEREIAPSMGIWELSESRERNRFGGTVRVLVVRVEALVRVHAARHPAEISNGLLGDIERALILSDMQLDELIDDIQDIAAEITHFPTDKQLAGATLDFEISYTTEWGNPYLQA